MKPQTMLRGIFVLASRFLLTILPLRRACQVIGIFTRYLPWKWGQPLIAHLSLLLNGSSFPRFRVRTKQHFEMLLDLADTSIQRYIYFLREWEPNEAKIIKSALREGDVFLDLGANVGYFSLLAAQVVGATGKVYAFEAQPAICVQLKENVNLNGFVNVQIMNLAIADRISDFIVEDVSGLGNRGAAMLIPREPGMPVIKVAGTTIDEFCRSQQVKDVGLIKMDIEGSEMLALKGMRDLLSTPNAPDMLCEINEPLLKRMGSSGNEIYSYMSGMGYQMYQSSKRGLERVVAKEFAAHSDPLGDNYFFSKRLDLPEQFSI